MMSVGTPIPAPPNQVTTKPRQLPGSNNGGPDSFDPKSIGADVDEEHEEANGQDGDQEDTVGDEEPGAQFTAMLTDRLAIIANQVWDANPALGPLEAMAVAQDTLESLIRTEGFQATAYQLHEAAWADEAGPVRPTPYVDWMNRAIAWMSAPTVHAPGTPWHGTPVPFHAPDKGIVLGIGAHPGWKSYHQRNQKNPRRSTRLEEALGLAARDIRDQVKQRAKGVPGGVKDWVKGLKPSPQTQQPQQTQPPVTAPAQTAPTGPAAPATWGEWARHQIDTRGQEAARALWKMRFDQTPYRPDQKAAPEQASFPHHPHPGVAPEPGATEGQPDAEWLKQNPEPPQDPGPRRTPVNLDEVQEEIRKRTDSRNGDPDDA